MATRRWGIDGVVQGYTGTQLQDDLKTLAELRSEIVYKKYSQFDYDEDVTKLIVGKACAGVVTAVDESLEKLFETLKDLLPAQVVRSVTRHKWDADEEADVEYQDAVPELHYKMGPLKKVSRITQKAVHYAVCDKKNPARPQLEQVRDILRATMVFPPGAWGEASDQIGTRMIDAINKHFDGAVVQIKNRFIETHFPNFAQLDGTKLPADLEKFIAETFKQTLWARDSFYRDIQLLIRIDNNKFDNGQGMTHTILELQLASSKMYSGKTDKKSGGSGHDMYKNVRAVTEYCEYLWWRDRHAKNTGPLNLPDAVKYYDAEGLDFEKFISQSETMARLYLSKSVKGMSTALARAIDDSKWFATVKK